MIILSIIITLYVVIIGIAAYEYKNAKTIPSNEPFLYGDYDPKKDPTLKTTEVKEKTIEKKKTRNYLTI